MAPRVEAGNPRRFIEFPRHWVRVKEDDRSRLVRDLVMKDKRVQHQCIIIDVMIAMPAPESPLGGWSLLRTEIFKKRLLGQVPFRHLPSEIAGS